LPVAYLLLNCDLGYERAVIEQLRHIEYVKEVAATFGTFDILAKLVSPTTSELNNTLSKEIRKVENIKGTLTLIGIEGQD